MANFDRFWSIFVNFDWFRAIFNRSYSGLIDFDQFWAIGIGFRQFLNHFGQFWSILVDFDWFMAILNRFWSVLIDFGWFWPVLVDMYNRTNDLRDRSKLIEINQNWPKLIELPKINQNRPKSIKIDKKSGISKSRSKMLRILNRRFWNVEIDQKLTI